MAAKCDDDNWITQTGSASCYRIYDGPGPYEYAQNICISVGAQLVAIESQTEKQFLANKFPLHRPLIGLQKITGSWTWPTNSTDILDNLFEIEGVSNQNCARISPTGRWVTDFCNLERFYYRYICERPPQAGETCHNAWVSNGTVTSCYGKYNIKGRNKSYEAAEEGCSSKGAKLITIETYDENEHVVSFLNAMETLYIGLRRYGVWTWTTGDTNVLDNWATEKSVGYHCAYMANDVWYTTKCNQPQANSYICEKPIQLYVAEGDEPITICANVTSEESFRNNGDSQLILAVSLPISVVLLVIVIWIVRRMYISRKLINTPQAIPDSVQLSQILSSSLEDDIKLNLKSLLLHRNTIAIHEMHGQGAFGVVYRASYTPAGESNNTQTVAIKTLKVNCTAYQITGLAHEAVTMSNFNHIHVLSIIGVCIRLDDDVPMLILPYMENGDLKTYLRTFMFDEFNTEPPDKRQLLTFCLQISRGMEYLAGQQFVHRDLAARNCMLDSQLMVKIADFGLAHDIYTSSYYQQDQQKLLPIKWMAAESLEYRVFTLKTDVWSFGVTMWEVLTYGKEPYLDLGNNEVATYLKTGARLQKPDNCSDIMYNLMMSCWKDIPGERPSFGDISKMMSDFIANASGYMDLNQETHNYDSVDIDSVNIPNETVVCLTGSADEANINDYLVSVGVARDMSDVHATNVDDDTETDTASRMTTHPVVHMAP